ncbi:MAG TPA: hypothetical protein VFS60_12375 [Thermoanaerobaculia bacterium]|nr:hypothetical protein [Thermoanaerobaculia bacterium]
MAAHFIRLALALVATLTVAETAYAACLRAGNPKAQEVELLTCTTAQAYFEANYEALHPADSPGPSREDGASIFAAQLAQQPGVVIKVNVLRLREYVDAPEYSWHGRWKRQPAEVRMLYVRQPDLTCDAIREGAIVQFIWAPQCCDTGYRGEIGCHLKLPMVEALPDELLSPNDRASLSAPPSGQDPSPNPSLSGQHPGVRPSVAAELRRR